MESTYRLSFKDDSGQGYALESQIVNVDGKDCINYSIYEIEDHGITTAKGQCLRNILEHQLRPLIKILISVERMTK
tara:strand:- start:565 stop:792 length:228 start_codon:yes stop_codon:yes gene_type:complete